MKNEKTTVFRFWIFVLKRKINWTNSEKRMVFPFFCLWTEKRKTKKQMVFSFFRFKTKKWKTKKRPFFDFGFFVLKRNIKWSKGTLTQTDLVFLKFCFFDFVFKSEKRKNQISKFCFLVFLKTEKRKNQISNLVFWFFWFSV